MNFEIKTNIITKIIQFSVHTCNKNLSQTNLTGTHCFFFCATTNYMDVPKVKYKHTR